MTEQPRWWKVRRADRPDDVRHDWSLISNLTGGCSLPVFGDLFSALLIFIFHLQQFLGDVLLLEPLLLEGFTLLQSLLVSV